MKKQIKQIIYIVLILLVSYSWVTFFFHLNKEGYINTDNMEYMRFGLYMIQIILMIYLSYLWYKNLNELKRRNNIEESPYISFKIIWDNIEIKNYWKTPIIIDKLCFTETNWTDPVDIKTIVYDIMPWELVSIEQVSDLIVWSWFISIIYSNHIESNWKSIKYNSPWIELT